MKFNYLLPITLLCSFILYSCDNEDDIIIGNTSYPIHFSSQISDETNTINTKATGSSWNSGDRIGVYMKSAGQQLSDLSVIAGASNKAHRTANGDGIFFAESSKHEVHFPENNTNVDFVAYYPYQNTITDYTYKINVSNQNSPRDIDLLYSNNVVDANATNKLSGLGFKHRLTQIVFYISSSSNVITLTGLNVRISGVKTRADFNLADGTILPDADSEAIVTLNTTINGNKAQSKAILIPDNGGAGRTVTFELANVGTFTYEIPVSTVFEQGHKYTYNITLNAEGIIINPSYGWIETPSIGPLGSNFSYITHMMSANNKIRNYSMLYDKDNKLAYWVAYPLHEYYIGNSGRTNAWRFDPKILPQFQPTLNSGFPGSGIDRGHQIPSADRTKDKASNATTFYYSNMTAQNSKLNQNIWVNLETKVRAWMKSCDTLYVVTGAMIKTQSDQTVTYVYDKSGKKIAKPKAYYKALAKRIGENTFYTIAFRFDNVAYPNNNYNAYRLTVQQLEQETGFTFFPTIPAETKNQIVTSQWN